MDPYQELSARIAAREVRVGVLGLGYVGLPLAEALHEGGLTVLGLDSDLERVRALVEGRAYLRTFGEARSRRLAESSRFAASADLGRLRECDVVIVCVPTPLDSDRTPDLSHVLEAARYCGHALRRGQLFVLESTTYPGTTRDEFLGELRRDAGDLELGQDFFVAYSPEREDPGRTDYTTGTIPKLVGGLEARSGALAAALFRHAIRDVVEVSSAEVAEAAKILENTFRAVNIALVNELKVLLDTLELDVWEVIDAAATKPFGFMRFEPGPGLGGHCIPVDPFYLAWKARQAGCPSHFIELAGEVNAAMPLYVVGRLLAALEQEGRAPRGARVLLLGAAYKREVDETRGSPSLALMAALEDAGALVSYSDPYVPRLDRATGPPLRSLPLSAALLASCDAVLVATDHSAFDWALVGRHARLIVDTRNALRRAGVPITGRLVKA